MKENATNSYEFSLEENSLSDEAIEYLRRRKNRNKLILSIVLIVAIALVITVVILGLNGFFTPVKDKQINEFGVTVTLTNKFKEAPNEGFDVVYKSKKMVFSIKRWTKEEFHKELGPDLNAGAEKLRFYTLNRGTKIYPLVSDDGHTFYYFTYSVGDNVYNYFVCALYEGDQGYYVINVGGPMSYCLKNEQQIINLLKSIVVE